MVQNILETFEANIIKWYPFKNDAAIIQIGTNKTIENELKKVLKDVKSISKIDELEENTKYDYALIYGYEKQTDTIEKTLKVLNENGKLLIIGNNEFGINNWSKYDKVLELEKHCEKLSTIKKIKETVKKNGLDETNTFYVFPNYKYAEIIINEQEKIEKGHIERYCPEIDENEIKIFDENKILKNIIVNNPEMIEFFANSYFIEASKKEIDTDIKLVSYNNCRKEKYRLITIIKEDIVEKMSATVEAKEHINNMKETIQKVKNSGIEILDYEKDDRIYSKLIKNNKKLDEIINENYDNLEYIINILKDIENILLKNAIEYAECKDKVNLRGENEESISKLHFLQEAFWDMIPKNCFYINEQYTFFDQEWKEEYLPAEFLIYRAIVNSYDLVRNVNIDELLEKLGILEYKEYFQKIDEELRNEIIDKEIFEVMYLKNIKAVDNLINDQKITNKCNEQIKEDNNNKQKYIIKLEEDNRKKQEYIEMLEKDRTAKQEYISKLEEKANKKFHWRGK